jgi:hypothetical protein
MPDEASDTPTLPVRSEAANPSALDGAPPDPSLAPTSMSDSTPPLDQSQSDPASCASSDAGSSGMRIAREFGSAVVRHWWFAALAVAVVLALALLRGDASRERPGDSTPVDAGDMSDGLGNP